MATIWKKIIGVRLATWIYFKGSRCNDKLPFSCNAFSKKRDYKTVDDIWNELIWFSTKEYPKLKKRRDAAIRDAQNDKTGKKKIPKPILLGKDLYYNQFCKPEYLCEDWMYELIEDVYLSIVMNIPIASNLQSCSALIADYYGIIKEEIVGTDG